MLLAGKPLIQHVYEAATHVPQVSDIRVLTDDTRIARAVENFHGHVMVIDRPCRTGTDRVAIAGSQMNCSVIVNLQADEIPLDPSLLSDLINPFLLSDAKIGTLKRRIDTATEVNDSSLVKVVTDTKGNALYFSRSPIPYVRDLQGEHDHPITYFGHLGVYIYRYEMLLEFAKLPTGVLEDSEKLEQLRALEHGVPMRVWETTYPSLRIDRPEEVAAATAQYLHYQENSTNASSTAISTQ